MQKTLLVLLLILVTLSTSFAFEAYYRSVDSGIGLGLMTHDINTPFPLPELNDLDLRFSAYDMVSPKLHIHTYLEKIGIRFGTYYGINLGTYLIKDQGFEDFTENHPSSDISRGHYFSEDMGPISSQFTYSFSWEYGLSYRLYELTETTPLQPFLRAGLFLGFSGTKITLESGGDENNKISSMGNEFGLVFGLGSDFEFKERKKLRISLDYNLAPEYYPYTFLLSASLVNWFEI